MKDKKTLYTIIVLLVIFLPPAAYGTFMHIKNANAIIDDNPNKDYILNNKVYFYTNNTLVKTYACKGTCSKAELSIDDEEYGIHYYKEGTEDVPTNLGNGYAIFKEGDTDILYSIDLDNKVLEFQKIKTYAIAHTNPIIIVKNTTGTYGALSITNFQVVVPYEYDFIGIPKKIIDGKLDTSKFVVNKNNNWYIMQDKETLNKRALHSPIIDFNDNYLITRTKDNNIEIYDYEQNNKYLDGLNKVDAYCIDNYLIVISKTLEDTLELLIYSDANSDALKTITIPNYKSLDFNYIDNKIEVILNNQEFQTIDVKEG